MASLLRHLKLCLHPSCPQLALPLEREPVFLYAYLAPPLRYAAPPIEASNDAISGRPAEGAGAAPPG